MRTLVILSTFILWAIGAKAAELIFPSTQTEVSIQSEGYKLFGTLQLPEAKKELSILLLIAGSGPTDRDGNQPNLNNNSFKLLANELVGKGIASLRYDKRGIAKSYYPGFSNASILFDDYVNDASNWILYLKAQNKYTKVYVAGLSEGSLIGMLAAQKAGADGFISLNGPGRPADEIIINQVSNPHTPDEVVELVKSMINKVKAGEKVEDVPPYLMGLFNADIQPYLRSWFKYNPATEIGKLKVPVQIIQGKNDIQVQVEDAEMLKKSQPKAQLILVDEMNHILKNAPADPQQNFATYSNPDLPLNDKLVNEIVTFIQQ
ncbi:MAG: alpha/beta hydrolase [Prolixibacteraceae bacterium]|nr:alpha/beta hydrolase [Prolixibacteraceae bacterium]